MLESGVLHRDLSDGNIIIWRSMMSARGVNVYDLVSRTTGKVVDIDHAKGTEKKKIIGNSVPSSGMVQRQTQNLNSKDFNIPVTEGAVAQALKFADVYNLANYCRKAIQLDVMKLKSDDGDWTAEDLGWNDVGPQPDFDSHFPDDSLVYMAKRRFLHPRGTIPFISYMAKDPDVHKNAIHDMESLFWVLIHVCIIREAGDRHRWKDLPEEHEISGTPVAPEGAKTPKPETPEERKRREEHERKTLIEELFYSDQKYISSEKAIYFYVNSNAHFEYLLNHIHDYFDLLKDLLRRWRYVLLLGYTFQAYEYYLVHHYIMKIIDDTLTLPAVQNEDKDTPFIQQEQPRRAQDYKFICVVPDAQGRNTSSGSPPSALSPCFPPPPSRARVPQAALNRALPPSSTVLVANHPYLPIATPKPTPNRLPTSSPSSAPSSSHPSNVVGASVPTTPTHGHLSAVRRQTHTSPKMPIPKKARKE